MKSLALVLVAILSFYLGYQAACWDANVEALWSVQSVGGY